MIRGYDDTGIREKGKEDESRENKIEIVQDSKSCFDGPMTKNRHRQ